MNIVDLNAVGRRVARGDYVEFQDWWMWSQAQRTKEVKPRDRRQEVFDLLRHPNANGGQRNGQQRTEVNEEGYQEEEAEDRREEVV